MAQSRSFSFDDLSPTSTGQEVLYDGHAHGGDHGHGHRHSRHGNQHPYQDSPTRSSPLSPPPPPPPPPPPSTPLQFSLTPHEPSRVTPPSPTAQRYHPSAHPDSNFGQARSARNGSLDSTRHSHSFSQFAIRQDYSQPPPTPPHHRKLVAQPPTHRLSGQDQRYPLPPHPSRPLSSSTFGMDDLGESRSERGSDRVSNNGHATPGQEDATMQPFSALDPSSIERAYVLDSATAPFTSPHPTGGPPKSGEASRHLRQQGSYSSSTIPIAAGAATPGSITPILPPSDGSAQSLPLTPYQPRPNLTGQSPYQDSPYQNSSLNFAPQVSHANIIPQNIADDGDDGFIPVPKRRSMLGRGGAPANGVGMSATATGGGAAAGGIIAALSDLAGRKQKAQAPSGDYDPVRQPENMGNGGGDAPRPIEKSEWLSRQTKGNNRMRWVVGLVIGLVVLLAIIGGTVGGVLGSRSASKSRGEMGSSPGDSVNNADDDTAANGDLGKDSAEIKALMNNADLRKVFPAMDYTPWGTQYPLCLQYPPSQNNITRDLAVLSQLTNTVRLYGTDCNQTEMVLHSINRLDLTSMKIWLGVWIETNTTTNDRQLEQMYNILEHTSDHSIFKGVIVGNEALYRAGDDKAATQQHLIQILTEVKSNFTSLDYDLPVTTSDLGDNWNEALVQAVDVVMSNIHPFFAGVPVEEAAGWTWNFWQMKNAPLTQGTNKPQVISEIGWPSGGGNDCGTLTTKCADPNSGSVAGIDEMNILMADFVCQAMDNGTDYFWFEAFDEPWKVVYNDADLGQEWEDKWGLMDPARKLKPGLKIPDCGGRTVR